jgi:hypothetical protein
MSKRKEKLWAEDNRVEADFKLARLYAEDALARALHNVVCKRLKHSPGKPLPKDFKTADFFNRVRSTMYSALEDLIEREIESEDSRFRGYGRE